AIKAPTDQTANTLMAASERFAAAQESLLAQFRSGLNAMLEDPAGDSLSAELASDRLALIDKHAFEDWLTTRVLITKAETLYRAQLLPLKVRMETLGLADQAQHQSPFGPALLVHAFQRAVRP